MISTGALALRRHPPLLSFTNVGSNNTAFCVAFSFRLLRSSDGNAVAVVISLLLRQAVV